MINDVIISATNSFEKPVGRSLTLLRRLVIFFLVFCFSGCASYSERSLQNETVQLDHSNAGSYDGVLPVFTTLQSDKPHNRIGFIEAFDDERSKNVRVNTTNPVVYVANRTFTTEKGVYSNSIFRVHFEKTPFSLVPFYLTAGKHPGLLVVLTRDRHKHVVLVTFVQTCGCYVTIIPTTWLGRECYPSNWPQKEISVYGETYPAQLEAVGPDQFIELIIKPDTHRVMRIQVIGKEELSTRNLVTGAVASQDSLRHLKTEQGRETSFYYQAWPLRGHVKGAVKWWEMLLLSIPSLDLFVGMDKEFGSTEQTGNPFYTSLQPWFRTVSDMNDFATFLAFHGWKL